MNFNFLPLFLCLTYSALTHLTTYCIHSSHRTGTISLSMINLKLIPEIEYYRWDGELRTKHIYVSFFF